MSWTTDFARTMDQACWTADGFDGCTAIPSGNTGGFSGGGFEEKNFDPDALRYALRKRQKKADEAPVERPREPTPIFSQMSQDDFETWRKKYLS